LLIEISKFPKWTGNSGPVLAVRTNHAVRNI
jgi:hypothetical protein